MRDLSNRVLRDAIESTDRKEVSELEALLSALNNIRWKAGDRSAD
jgi:hypothetical protein